jgi:hypothetical protein
MELGDQIPPVDYCTLGVVAGKGGTGFRSEKDKAGIRRTGKAKGQFDYRVEVGGEDSDVSQADTHLLVQAPIDKGQENQIEFFLAEEGSRLEKGIEERVAKRLDPEDSICAPRYQRSQKLSHDQSTFSSFLRWQVQNAINLPQHLAQVGWLGRFYPAIHAFMIEKGGHLQMTQVHRGIGI